MISSQLVTLKIWAPLVKFSIRNAQDNVNAATVNQLENGIATRNAHKIDPTSKAIRTPKNNCGLRISDSGIHEKIVAGTARCGPTENSIGVNATTTANNNSSQVAICPNAGVASS